MYIIYQWNIQKVLQSWRFLLSLKPLLWLFLGVIIPVLYTKKQNFSGRLYDWVLVNKLWCFGTTTLFIVTFFLEYVFVAPPPPNIGELTLKLFTLTDYQQELDKVTQPSNWENDKKQLIEKFKFAEYALEKVDYEQAKKILLEVKEGRDLLGNLPKVESYTIENNLGYILFKQQRNKGFSAFVYFQSAQKIAEKDAQHLEQVNANLDMLDKMTNNID